MTMEQIRDLRRAVPFRPFTLVLDDGRRLNVDTPVRLAISPKGTELAYASADGPVFLRPADVSDAPPMEAVQQR